jgi:hypothetical protein
MGAIIRMNLAIMGNSKTLVGVISFGFALCCAAYPMDEAATNLIIKEHFDGPLGLAIATHQRIKLAF